MSSSSGPPRRDKFAALAHQQHQQQQQQTSPPSSTPTTAAAAAPRRDKFAAMAARTNEATTATANPVAQRRDKFAAVRQQQQGSSQDSSNENAEAMQLEQEEQVTNALQEKCRQRDLIWKDMEIAEAKTIELLGLAERTAALLSTGTTTTSSSAGSDLNPDVSAQVRECTRAYQETLQEIHKRLEGHASFVVAYDATTQQQRPNRTYQTRVELRLANTQLQLLRQLVALEKSERNQFASEQNPMTASTEHERRSGEGAEALPSTKRKRDSDGDLNPEAS